MRKTAEFLLQNFIQLKTCHWFSGVWVQESMSLAESLKGIPFRSFSRITKQAKSPSSGSKSASNSCWKHYQKFSKCIFMLLHLAQTLWAKVRAIYLHLSFQCWLEELLAVSSKHSTILLGVSWQGHWVFKWLLSIHTVSTCCCCCSLSKSSTGSLVFHHSDWKCQQIWHGSNTSTAAGEDLRGGSEQP